MKLVLRALTILSAIAALLLATGAARADPLALWHIVHDGCVPQARDNKSPPRPCDAVDLPGGVAFLKDRVGVAQMLAIATRPVSGIEDPFLLATDAPNYFALAWQDGRPLVESHLGSPLPRQDVVLAINAKARRSQDQFHIHVDCIDPEVAAELAASMAALSDDWHPLAPPLKGRIYQARRLIGEPMTANPFRLLADGLPDAKAHPGQWSLAVVGAAFDGTPGFILLADETSLLGGGHVEALQDHSCAIVGRH